jgi:capsular polysaccharide biosynthesis protein
MTEFEIQRKLRAMNAPRTPEHDLWPAIASRIESSSEISTTRRRWIPLAAAASTVIAIIGGLAFFALRDRVESNTNNDYAMTTRIERISPSEAREQVLRTGEDPRLAGPNIVLDAAHSELQQALEQHPDAVFLVSLLNRTNAQRMKLEQFGAKAG